MFLLAVCFCFLSQGAIANLFSNSFVSLFCCFVVPRRVANAKLLFIFGTALEQIVVRHRFAHSKILKNSKNAAFFCATS